MDTLKKLLTTIPILALSHTSGRYTVDIDACDTLVGRVLLQEQLVYSSRPFGYWSRTLNDWKTKLVTTHKECFSCNLGSIITTPIFTRYTVYTSDGSWGAEAASHKDRDIWKAFKKAPSSEWFRHCYRTEGLNKTSSGRCTVDNGDHWNWNTQLDDELPVFVNSSEQVGIM